MQNLYESLGVWGLFISAFISSTVAPGGSEAVLAYLVDQGRIPATILLSAATLGNTLGAITTWMLGFWVAKRYPLDALKNERQQKAVHSVRRFGWPILLFSWLPIVGDAFCFAAGWLKLSFVLSVFAMALGKAFRYAAIVYWFI